MREGMRLVFIPPELRRAHPEAKKPLPPLLAPVVKPFVVRSRLHKELHLHLLKLAGPKEKILRVYFIAERFADLRDPVRNLLPRSRHHIQEIHVDSLGSLRPKVDNSTRVLHGADKRFEHEIETSCVRELPFSLTLDGLTTLVRRIATLGFLQLIRAKTCLALATINHRISEMLNVAARLPDTRLHQDRGVDALDVVAKRHRPPPFFFDVPEQFNTKRAVVPASAQTTVNLT